MVDSLEAERIVLENWKKERADLDAAIAVLESKIAARASRGVHVGSVNHIEADAFFRMTVPDAIRKFLKMVGKPARPVTDIVDALNRGGLTAAYPTVYTSLTRLRDKGGEVVKVGDSWGLDLWYPRAPGKLKVEQIFGTEEEPEPIETPEEEKEEKARDSEHARSSGKKRKEEVAEFIKTHGPSTRPEILAGTDVPAGSFAYCVNDKNMFIKGEDGRYRNVE